MTTRTQSHSMMRSASDALSAEEVKRTRVLLRVGWLIGLVVAVAVLIAPGQHEIERALLVMLDRKSVV